MGVSAVMFQLRGPLEIPIQSLMWEWQPLFQQTHSAFTSYPTLPPPPATGDAVKAHGETWVSLASALSSSLQLVFNATLLLEPFV